MMLAFDRCNGDGKGTRVFISPLAVQSVEEEENGNEPTATIHLFGGKRVTVYDAERSVGERIAKAEELMRKELAAVKQPRMSTVVDG